MRERRRRIPSDEWCRLSVRWYADPVLRAATRQAPVAMALFPVILGKAKAASHGTENPDGSIVISLEDLAGACCTTKGRAASALKALEEGELVSVGADRVGLIRITLNGFAKWQTPRQSKAARMEVYAERKRAVGAGKNGAIRDGSGTENTLDSEEEVDTERTTPSAHASAPAREATESGGGVPAEPSVLAPTRPEQYAAEILKCKRDLGSLSLDAQSAEAAMRDERGVNLEPSWLLTEFYRPAALLLPEFGVDATRQAIASIVTRPDVSKPAAWMRRVAERAAAELANAKPKKAVESFAERKAREDKAAMLASLRVPPVVNPEAV